MSADEKWRGVTNSISQNLLTQIVDIIQSDVAFY